MRERYRLERSDRKTVQLKVCLDGSLVIRAPLHFPLQRIDQFVAQNSVWIEKQREVMKKRAMREMTYAQTSEQIEALKQAAREIIPKRVAYYSNIMGVTPNSVKITSAAKRFGSCSGKNGLCFSYRIMMYPDEAIDYVVVHELAHIRHHDHSKAFYDFIAKTLPDYREREAILQERS